MSSTPGHFNRVEVVGDVRLLHRRPDGTLAGVLLMIHTGEPVELAVLSRTWPPGVAVGTRLHVQGTVQREPFAHRKNSHFVQAAHVSLIPRRQAAS